MTRTGSLMAHGVSIAAACAFLAAVLFAAGETPKEPDLAFKTLEGKKAFEDGKKAFMERKRKEAGTFLAKAKGEALNKAAKEEVNRWVEGLAGLDDYLKIEPKAKTQGGWAYENAQRKALVYVDNPAGKLFRDLIEELEKPERKLVQKIEAFEGGGPYSEDKGKTFAMRAREPQHVIEGERSLRWECKNKDCVTLKITSVPADWSQASYVAFWLYEEDGKNSQLQVSVRTGEPAKKEPAKKKDAKKEPAPPKAKAKAQTKSFDGFQTTLEPHVGWKYIVLEVDKGKGLRRIGKGDLSAVEYFHIQIPQVKKFVAYVDDIVLVRKN